MTQQRLEKCLHIGLVLSCCWTPFCYLVKKLRLAFRWVKDHMERGPRHPKLGPGHLKEIFLDQPAPGNLVQTRTIVQSTYRIMRNDQLLF